MFWQTQLPFFVNFFFSYNHHASILFKRKKKPLLDREQVTQNNEFLCTLIRSKPASILSCSTNFLAWAMLLVVDILCHRLSCQVKGENSTTKEKCGKIKTEAEFKAYTVSLIDKVWDKWDKILLEVFSNSLHTFRGH